MSETNIFSGGVPTAPDVKRLRDNFPDNTLQVGQQVKYGEVEKILGCSKHSYRFKTVTFRWRRLVEKESNVIIGTDTGKGFVILDDHQKLSLSGSKLRTAARFAKRSYIVAGHINRRNLTDDEASRLDHQGKVAGAVLAAAAIKRNAELPTI